RPSFPMSFPDRTALFLKLAVLLLLPSAHLYSQAAARTKSIEGLWGAELRLGMPVAGTLTLDSRSGNWKASIAGYEVPAVLNENHLTFSLPAHLGSFRGHFNARSQALQGDWIQPGGILMDSQYATPLNFHPDPAGVWRAEVVPLEQ